MADLSGSEKDIIVQNLNKRCIALLPQFEPTCDMKNLLHNANTVDHMLEVRPLIWL